LDGEATAILGRSAVANGSRAVGTIVYVAPDAEERLGWVRSVAGEFQVGASAWDGMLIARALAPDGASLRRIIIGMLRVLRGERPLPRVWLC